MSIFKGKTYRIKGASQYFEKKYGTPNPRIIIEGPDTEVLGKYWAVGALNGNPACLCFAMRSMNEGRQPSSVPVFYGHISMPGQPSLGELVWEDELEEVEN